MCVITDGHFHFPSGAPDTMQPTVAFVFFSFSLFIPTEEIINSIQNSQSDYQSPDSCTLYNRIRRASCSSNDDELRRRESPSGSGKRSTFTSSSYDSPGSLPSHYSGSYRGSSRAGSISRDESSLEVFEVSVIGC